MIRRLYDIANIMTSLELISKKVLVGGKGRKPQYIYIGPQPFANKGLLIFSSQSKIKLLSKPFFIVKYKDFRQLT